MSTELEELFPPGSGSRQPVALLRRNGRVQLAIPLRRKAAAISLELYPAQRAAARMVRCGLRLLAAAGLPLPLPRGSIALPADDAFVQFLAPPGNARSLDLAVLAGNPGAGGRRWVCLVFADGEPVTVVKAGTTPEARALIVQEADFLASHRPAGAVVPSARHGSARVAAFALPFISAHRDQRSTVESAIEIVTPWLHPDARSTTAGRPPFQALSAHVQNERESRLLAAAGAVIAPETLAHGDFAPWNLKRERHTGAWRVLDWERGEVRGIPGWDVFHFLIQPLVLVKRAGAAEIAEHIRSFLAGRAWRAFATRAGIGEAAPLLLWAYLFHAARVQRQTEGAKAIANLLQIYTDRCTAG